MSESKETSRRKLIKSVAAAGGVVATSAATQKQWTSPVVRSLVLPAHAETSVVDFFGGGVTAEVAMIDRNAEQIAGRSLKDAILDSLVPNATAHRRGPRHEGHVHSACAIDNGDGFDITYQRGIINCEGDDPVFPHRYAGSLPKDGDDGDLDWNGTSPCGEPPCESLRANIVGYEAGDSVLTISVDGGCPKEGESQVNVFDILPSPVCSFEELLCNKLEECLKEIPDDPE